MQDSTQIPQTPAAAAPAQKGGEPQDQTQIPPAFIGWPALPDRKTLTTNEWASNAGYQFSDGHVYHWRGGMEMQDASMLVKADEADYDEETHSLKARGNVYFHDFEKNEQIWCDEMDYNTETKHGYFYEVSGETMPKAVVRKGVLSGSSPFHFEGLWAERIGSRYLVYYGWMTDCKFPDPWWTLKAKKFDIIPQDRAIAYRGTYFLHKVPVFYFPLPFYRPLRKEPRKSGFLLPNIVPRSQRGFMLGLGYYWAINRSYDLTYRFQDFNSNALKHNIDLRGKPTARSDFDFILYGVNDMGGDPRTGNPATGSERQKYSGLNIYFTGRDDLGGGWTAAGQVNYVTSFRFRQEWSESFNEAIGSEMHSDAFLNRDFSTYTFDLVASRIENFQSTEIQTTNPNGSYSYQRNAVLLHKLPEADFGSRDHSIFRDLPVWFSFDSSAGLLYRFAPVFLPPNNALVNTFETNQFTTRLNFNPRVSTSLHWHGINFTPTLGLDEAYYGESQNITYNSPDNLFLYHAQNEDIVRSAREFSLDIALPTIERVFNKKTFLGDKLKHVIEPRVTYRLVDGIGTDFDRIIRFDESDILANTNELALSLTNRLYAKRGDNVVEVFTWELMQKRYFDPTFGGAVIPGQRNVFAATADVTPYAFVAGPRTYSPVASMIRANPVAGLTFTWMADYDPFYRRIVDSTVEAGYRWKKYYVNAGDNLIRSNPLFTANSFVPLQGADQWRFTVGFGDPQHRGWNAATTVAYDMKKNYLQYMTTQVTYNTDCCGLSVEYRRLNAGVRDETQIYISFAIANIGNFGTLKKQDRLF